MAVNVIDYNGFGNRALRYEHGNAADAATSGLGADRDEVIEANMTVLTAQGTEAQGRDALTSLYTVAQTVTEVRIYINAAKTSYISMPAVVTSLRIQEALGGYSYLVDISLQVNGDRWQIV